MRHLLATLLVVCWPLPAAALPTFTGFGALLEVEHLDGGRGTLVHLVSGGLLGVGGIAHGLVDLGEGGGRVDALWLVQDAAGARPPDESRILSFAFDDTGNYSGIQPTPFYDPNATGPHASGLFRIFLSEYPPDPIVPPEPIAPAAVIGELDFSAVTGAALGSLTDITGVRLVDRSDNGPDLAFAPFTLQAIAEPPALALVAGALLGAVLWPRRRRRSRVAPVPAG